MGREEDMKAEAELGIFLDKYLYDCFPGREEWGDIVRIHDKPRQLSGIDVQFITRRGAAINIDEKAQLGYINKNLPTFAFEITSIQTGGVTIGWLCNTDLKTHYYLLVWPWATQDSSKGITWDRFTKADCLLISKNDLLYMLEQEGLTRERMLSDAKRYRSEKRQGRIPIDGKEDIYYFATPKVKRKEEPINVIIRKERLFKLADCQYVVTRDAVKRIPNPANGE